jgi:WD40 repeat protein
LLIEALFPATTLTGRTLGDFTVGERLGEGGQGVVYHATQRGLDRDAVIKVLHAGARDSTIERFLREAQIASRLDHPYAAHIYAFGAEPDGLCWIAMELVRGTTLRRVLDAQPGGRMPVARLVPIIEALCDVVHTAHEQGIVHRDLKPENVMVVARAGRLLPKLLDLGVAKRVGAAGTQAASHEDAAVAAAEDPATASTMTASGALVGTPLYMAPEQWQDDGEISPATDVYALGVMVWEALTGERPFHGASLLQLARAHLRDEPPPWPDELPEAIGAVLHVALSKRAADRPASALAFAQGLRAGAGLRVAADQLPRLDDDLRAEVSRMPGPIADAVAALETAHNPHQARDACWQIVRASARYLGVLALAARSQLGSGGAAIAPAVGELLRALRRRELAEEEWLELVRGLTRPFEDAREAYPVPELIALCAAEPSPFAALDALRAAEMNTTSEESLRERLARTLPLVAALLRSIRFLADYPLVVARGDGRAEVWMGARRGRRPLVRVPDSLPTGTPVLADVDGNPLLVLAPLVAIAPPTPGADDELFLFAGPARAPGLNARLVSEPLGLEHHDDAIWAWLGEHVLPDDDDARPDDAAAPYLGLAPYTEADAGRFFGRERQTEAFVNQLHLRPLLAVVGPSGAGKSSFVRAGVIPALPDGWRAVALRPGHAPLAALDAADADLRTFPGETVVLVVDQLEELFTLCADADVRDRFAARVAEHAGTGKVVLTVRDDFLARAGALADWRELIAAGVVLLGNPAPEDLARTLVLPARRAGFDFDDPELPMRIVRAVAGQPGALALLSFTAFRLWELRDRHFACLTRRAYDAIGGVDGALADHAEATLAAAPAEQQRLIRDAFRHLVTAEGTRATPTRVELEQVLGGGSGAAAVIERLVAARLLVVADADQHERVEIVHEALIGAWPRLVEWRREDATGARLRDQLHAAARQWDERGRPRGLLWRDDAVVELRAWRARWTNDLPALDLAFADASARDDARGHRLRVTLVAAAVAVLVAGAITLALLYRRSEDNARTARDRLIASYVEQGRRLLQDGDYLRALPYLSAAYTAGDDSTTVRFLVHRASALADRELGRHQHGARVVAVAFRPGAHEVISTASDGGAAIWDARDGHVRAELPGVDRDALAIPAISADGARAVVPRKDHTLIWDGVSTHALPPATLAAIDPAGTTVALAEADRLSVWDAATGALRWSQPAPPLAMIKLASGDVVARDRYNVAHVFSPDGAAVLATRHPVVRLDELSDGGIALSEGDDLELWDPRARKLVAFDEPTPSMFVASSHDGHLLAIAQGDSAVLIYDRDRGRVRTTLTSPEGVVTRLAWSPDDRRLAVASSDVVLRVWDVASARPIAAFSGARDLWFGMAFDAGSERVVAGSDDGGVRVFAVDDPAKALDVDVGSPLSVAAIGRTGALFVGTSDGAELRDGRSGVQLARVVRKGALFTYPSPDGTRVAVLVAGQPDIEVRDLASGAVESLLHAPAPCAWASFDHAGERIAATAADGSVTIWSRDGRRLASIPGDGMTSGLSLAFSPDDRRLVSIDARGVAQVRDAETLTSLGEFRAGDSLLAASFDAAGARIVTQGSDKVARLWNATTLAPLRTFTHAASLTATALSPDGTLLAGAAEDGTISVWDTHDGAMLAVLHHSAAAEDVAFDPRAPRLLSTSDDHHAIVWDVGLEIRSPDEVARAVRCRSPYVLGPGGLEEAPTRCE